MLQKVQVRVIPTDKAQDCLIKGYGRKWYFFKGYITQEYLKVVNEQSYHLYFTINEEVREDCHYIYGSKLCLGDPKGQSAKVIASTNPDIWFRKGFAHNSIDGFLDIYKIPQSFIKAFVEKQGIWEVNLECGTVLENNSPSKIKYILNPDGTVVIHLILEKLYTEDDVKKAWELGSAYGDITLPDAKEAQEEFIKSLS